MAHDDFGTLAIVVSRQEVESGDIAVPLSTLQHLISSPQIIRKFRTRVDLSFDGYNGARDKLYEISAVRDYVHTLDLEFPYWLYFMSRHYHGLQCVVFCFLPPFLTDKARAEIHPQQLGDLMEHRWAPALSHICTVADFPESEADSLLESTFIYLRGGPIRPLQ